MTTKHLTIALQGVAGAGIACFVVFVASYFFLQQLSLDPGEPSRWTANSGSDRGAVDTATFQDGDASSGKTDVIAPGQYPAARQGGAASDSKGEYQQNFDRSGTIASEQIAFSTSTVTGRPSTVDVDSRLQHPDARRLLILVKQLNEGAGPDAFDAIQEHFDSSSTGPAGREFLLGVLEAYGSNSESISESQHDVLRTLLANSSDRVVGEYALSQLEQKGVRSSLQWLDLARDASAVSPDVQAALLEMLPNIQQPLDLALGITAIGDNVSSGSHESLNLVASLAGFAVHEDEHVRAVAASTVGALAKNHSAYRYVLENAMVDSSAMVRKAALASIVSEKIQSDAIRRLLFEVLRSNGDDKDQKGFAYEALRRYALSDGEKAELDRFDGMYSLAATTNGGSTHN